MASSLSSSKSSRESFAGEDRLVREVALSPERLGKMRTLAENHQSALAASDLIALRKEGVELNKSLVADYSRHVSRCVQDQGYRQDGEPPHDNFVKWLNVKKDPSMAEAPTMPVMQCKVTATSGGGGSAALHKVPISAFDENGGGRHGHLAVEQKQRQQQTASVSNVVLAAGRKVDKKNKKKQQWPDAKKKGTTKVAEDCGGGCHEIPEKAEEDDGDEAGKSVEGEVAGDASRQSVKTDSDSAVIARLASVHKDEIRARMEEVDRLRTQHADMKKNVQQIVDKLKSSGIDNVHAKNAAQKVERLCKELEKQRSLAASAAATSSSSSRAFFNSTTAGDGKGSSLLSDATNQLTAAKEEVHELQERLRGLEAERDLYEKGLKDKQSEVKHYKDVIETFKNQNVLLRNEVSREEREKHTHYNRSMDLGQRLASVLHYHATDEDDVGNASVYIKSQAGDCCCEEFEDSVAANEPNGLTILGSTGTQLHDVAVGERATLALSNATGLTTHDGEIVHAVELRRIEDSADGTKRAQLLTPLKLGEHTVQSDVTVTESDYYELKLNAK